MWLGRLRFESVIVFIVAVMVGHQSFRACLSRDNLVVSMYLPFETMRIIMPSCGLLDSIVASILSVLDGGSGVLA